jgi:hypothetical protein
MSSETTKNMTEEKTAERPMIITVICVLLFLGSLMALQAVMSDDFHGLPSTVRNVYLICVLLTDVAVIGLFLMRRWAVILYALVTIVGQGILIKYGWWNPVQLLFALCVIGVGVACFKRMR